MRHRRDRRHLSRTSEHRRALLRNLVTELFRHERIETTIAKAKEARRVAERMITFAKRGDLSARRHVGSYIFDETVTTKLFDTIAPWYTARQGGYTRIVRTGRRLGDAGEMGIFELVKSQEQIDAERKAREAAEAAARDKKKKGKAVAAESAEGAEAEAAPEKKGKKPPKAPKPPKAAKESKEARTKEAGSGAQKKERGKTKAHQKKGATKASKKG